MTPSSSTNHNRSERRGRRPRWVSANPGSGRRPRWGLCEPSDVGDENQLLGQVVLADGSQQVQQQHLKQAQHRHLIYANRSSREAVASACIRSTTRPKANRLRTTHATRDGPCGHVFATILGRGPPGWAAGPLSGQVEPGSPHSPARERGIWKM